jgi:2'-5' RNA ligase
VPEIITSSERFEKLRTQLSHHLTVGLLFDRRPDEAEEIQRALTEI